ncbi:hypothetical protein PPTG_03862 [Phytophthora nicotianae INRA-310]|uniref:Uncharacterized protein n=2 Tax=Phytophthora nicotianae TaxID=4792 RepID=W2R0Z7_PHYN3|nr:hypothetical protein PPTG_03862 [Phytophthora nicotianae INRA-310]ETM36587.1 hypothetical protein L914_16761 [Phytophthora nicotianae]ETN18180.1 hypothetical protein PPTG_03862 [Phytophthora nicotianae INRA-310]
MNDDGKDGVVLILMLALAHEGPQEKDERQRGQNYLTRADLHPEARYGTTWEAIYGAGNDRAFITTTGFDVSCFHCLLSCFEPRLVLKDGAPHPYQEMTSTLLVNPGRIVALFLLLQRSAWRSTISVLPCPSRLLHVQQAAKLFLQRRQLSLRAIKLIRGVLVIVQHNLPFVCSSWENRTDDL